MVTGEKGGMKHNFGIIMEDLSSMNAAQLILFMCYLLYQNNGLAQTYQVLSALEIKNSCSQLYYCLITHPGL